MDVCKLSAEMLWHAPPPQLSSDNPSYPWTVQEEKWPQSLPCPHTHKDDGMLSGLSIKHLISSFRKTREIKSLELAKSLHIYICIIGLDIHPVIGNHFVPLLVECGSLHYAYQTFLRLYQRTEHSWTSLIQGYVENGCFQNALDLFHTMPQYCINPSKYTFQAIVKCYARMKWLEKGQEIHCEIVKEDLEKDPFIGSSLIDLYAKNGLFLEALELLDNLALRNVVSWNALILGYVERGSYEQVLECVELMQSQGFFPDIITFNGCLKCSNNVVEAHKVHIEVVKCGFESDNFCGNALLDTYGRFGCFEETRYLFDGLLVRDIVSWNALMGGYIAHGFNQEVLLCWENMCFQMLSPNAPTFVFVLKACGSLGNPCKGQEIYGKLVKEGYENNVFVASAIVDMYVKCGWLTEAQVAFNKLKSRNIVLWGALISGYVEWGFGKEALTWWTKMMEIDGLLPNDVVYASILKARSIEGDLHNGQGLHKEILKRGFESDISVSNSIVYMYAKCGAIEESISAFSQIQCRDVVSWNSLISAFAENGFHDNVLSSFDMMHSEGIFPDAVTFVYLLQSCCNMGNKCTFQRVHMEITKEGFESEPRVVGALLEAYANMGFLREAKATFEEIPERDIICWNALISGYVEHGHGEEALHLIQKMEIECTALDDIILICGLKACAINGALYKGLMLHSRIIKQGYDGDLFVDNTLVVMYAKCDAMSESMYLFDTLHVRTLMTWNALMIGYACKGDSDHVFSMFERMQEEGTKPDGVTLLNILSVCNHDGLVDKGYKCFELFDAYGIIPMIEHYNSILDLLGRCGKLNEAFAMIDNLSIQLNQVVCNTILSACQKWGDVEIGLHMFEHATEVE